MQYLTSDIESNAVPHGCTYIDTMKSSQGKKMVKKGHE